MNWLLIALLAPILWSVSNFIDKFLVSKYFKSGTGTLFVYSCLIGLPVSLLILIFKPSVLNIGLSTAFLILLNGAFYISFLFPYFRALSKADTSTVIPIFQVIPVFSYFLALFVLGEILTSTQIFASLAILLGAVGMSMNFEGKNMRFRAEVVLLMLLASLIISFSTLMFKFFAIDLDFWTVSFWQYIGFFLLGIFILIFVKNYRNDFLSSFRKHGKTIISLNILNESINITGVVVFTFATLLAPLSLVWVITGLQPIFVFLLGSIFTIFAPHLIKEELGRRAIIQKVVFITLMIIGAYFLGI